MRELLIAIGLEALYQGNFEAGIRTGAPFISREIYLRGEMVMMLRPAEMMRLLQAGVEMRPVTIGPPPTGKKLRLVQ